MKIEWNKVTKLSQIVAIIIFVGVFFLGFCLGMHYQSRVILGWPINSAKFLCADNKIVYADFYKNFVQVRLGNSKMIHLPQTISASGVRYANDDESIVFWNKGNTAFVTQGSMDNITYKDCAISQSYR